MKDEILGLESDFANNEYFGTNVWTEEKYRVLSGKIPVLLSASHSVNQLRGDDVRSAEKYTGALTRYLSSSTSSYAIFQLFTHADPNMDVEHNYKNAIVNLIESYGIKLLIDIHSSNFSDDSDMDVVTNQKTTLCGFDDIPEKIKKIGLKYDVKVDENNVPNKNPENEIIAVSSLICGIPSIRIVINDKKLDVLSNNNKFENICKVLEEFITSFN